jgi:hypothetical protein
MGTKGLTRVAVASALTVAGMAALSTPAFAAEADSTTPADVYQAVGMPASGSCESITDTGLNWGDVGSTGWSAGWGAWLNDGAGGAACVRTLTFNENSQAWEVAA